MQECQPTPKHECAQQVGDGFIADLDRAEQRPADDSLRLRESANHEGKDDGGLELGEGIATTTTAASSNHTSDACADGYNDCGSCGDGTSSRRCLGSVVCIRTAW